MAAWQGNKQEERAAAQCFSTLAPAWLAPHLEPHLQHIWLGTPDQPLRSAAHADAEAVCIPLTELGTYRSELLAAMALHYGGDAEIHARALLSQWSKYYFWLAAPAGIVALLLRRPLDMSPARTRLLLREGMPAALYFAADALQPQQPDTEACTASLIGHLEAIIETLAGMTRIAPRVFWGNAGNLLDHLAGECAAMPGGADDIENLFRSCLSDGERNPLRTPVRRVQPSSTLLPNPFRVRRVCCMRNEIPGETNLCASCPLLLTMCDDELVRQESLQ